MKKKKKAPTKKEPEPTHFLTVCADCKIRLVVNKDKTASCYLCKSPNVSVTPWR